MAQITFFYLLFVSLQPENDVIGPLILFGRSETKIGPLILSGRSETKIGPLILYGRSETKIGPLILYGRSESKIENHQTEKILDNK